MQRGYWIARPRAQVRAGRDDSAWRNRSSFLLTLILTRSIKSTSCSRGALHEASWSGAGCGACGRGANVASRTRGLRVLVRAPLRGLRRSCRLDEGQANGGKPPGLRAQAQSPPSPRKNDPEARRRRGGALTGAAVRREADRVLLPPRLSARRFPSWFRGEHCRKARALRAARP